jgi:hypothetical protein
MHTHTILFSLLVFHSAAALALSNHTAQNVTTPTHSIIYFRYQSRSIPFDQWISMFTVCLAPLVTHVVFGFAEPVLLSDRLPRWTDRLAQFNPITIIWRWYSIVYRRIRAKNWDRADMAASNAIFWNGYRWDGSEEMMNRSRDWVTKLPEKTHVSLISSSTLATITMTLQGAGAVVRILQIRTSDWRAPGLALPSIFYPIAVLSFARLPASIWLSSEYGYMLQGVSSTINSTSSPEVKTDPHEPPCDIYCPAESVIWDMTSASSNAHCLSSKSRLGSSGTMGARLCTVCGVLFSLLGCGACAYYSVVAAGPKPFVIITSASSLAVRMFYFVLSVSGLFVFVFYILKGQAGSTVVPCMNAMWYKCLNGLIISLALAAFVLAALETTISPTGEAVTYWVPPP